MSSSEEAASASEIESDVLSQLLGDAGDEILGRTMQLPPLSS